MGEILSGQGIGKYLEKALLDAKDRIYVVSPYISKDYASIMIRKAAHGVKVKVITSDSPFRKYTVDLLKIYSGVPLPEVRGPKAIDFFQLLVSVTIPSSLFLAFSLTQHFYLMAIPLIISLSLPFLWKESPSSMLVSSALGISSGVISYLITKDLFTSFLILGFSCWLVSAIWLCSKKIWDAKRKISPTYFEKYQEEAFGPPRKVLDVKFVPEDKLVHSKIYIFDDVAFIGSANLTYNSLWKNVETLEIFRGEEVHKVEKEFEKIWNLV